MSDTEIQLRQRIGDIENLLRQRNAETARMKKGRFEGEEWQAVAKAYVDHLETSTDDEANDEIATGDLQNYRVQNSPSTTYSM